MALDAQTIVDTVAASDEATALSILQAVVESRPEFAAPLATMLVPDLTFPPAKALTEKRANGTVKSLNEMKGYGFIECPELHAIYGADVFLHSKQAQGAQKGQAVTFAVVLNKDGKPQAYDLQTEGGSAKGAGKGKGEDSWNAGKGKDGWNAGKGDSWNAGKGGDSWNAGKGGDSWGGGKGGKGEGEDAAGMMMSMMMALMGEAGEDWGGGDDKGKGKGKGGKGESKGESKGKSEGKPNVVEVVGEFQGTVKSFNQKSGYGFIECPDLKEVGCPNDVFLHHMQLNGFEVGDAVQFTCYMNRNGQPQAKDLVAVQDSAKKMRTF